MAKQTIEIEVPDGWRVVGYRAQTIEIEVPDGWRVVGYRAPKEGEYYLSNVSSSIRTASIGFTSKQVIIERDPDYVEAIEVRLKPGWIAMDANRQVYWYGNKPSMQGDGWSANGVGGISRTTSSCDIDLGTDWTKSLRRVK